MLPKGITGHRNCTIQPVVCYFRNGNTLSCYQSFLGFIVGDLQQDVLMAFKNKLCRFWRK